MTSWYDNSEVLLTTAKYLNTINKKYTSPDPSKFNIEEFTLGVTENNLVLQNTTFTPLAEQEYTILPPAYLDEDALDKELDENIDLYTSKALPPDWNQTYHYSPDLSKQEEIEKVCQYVLVLDTLNFCFWPLPGYEYEHLAASLKQTFESNPSLFDAQSLMKVTEDQLTRWLQPPENIPLYDVASPTPPITLPDGSVGYPIPLIHSRVRLLREVGAVLDKHFHGKAYNLIKMANGSARELVRLVTSYFPGFRDQSSAFGEQIFLYKRVQIFVGDIWGALKGSDVGNFNDMDFLTCFPDYRIPQLFRAIGVLKCNPTLHEKIDNREQIPANSEEELIIRSLTVQIVDLIAKKMKAKGHNIAPFQLDWILWERGEKLMKLNQMPPHHQTLTTYY